VAIKPDQVVAAAMKHSIEPQAKKQQITQMCTGTRTSIYDETEPQPHYPHP
jgi:hypothetical protein